jgi:hypothetical protein
MQENRTYHFTEAQRPNVAGAPYLVPHTLPRRVAYVVVALLMSLSGTFGNSLITENLAQLAGGYSAYSAEMVWLTGAFVGVGACSNLFVIKGRQQLGLPSMLFGALGLYALAAAADVVFANLTTAVLSRAANGLATSTAVAASVYYLMSALPASKRILAVATPIACVQLAQPLARLVPVDFLTTDSNTTLRLLVMLIPLLQIILLALNPLPPTYRIKVFEKLDMLTGPLVACGAVMLGCALAAGATYWWSDAPFVGVLLAGAVVTLGLALIVEARRKRPQIDISWLTHRRIAAFMGIALLERLALAVQTSSVPGLLALRSLNNDQYHTLFGWVSLAMLAGIVTMLATLGPKSLLYQMLAALGCIALGALLACSTNGSVRPQDLILSQCLIGFGATLFVGPALLFSISQVLKQGAQVLVPTVLVFAATQNLGSVAGSALLSSVQFAAQHYAIAGYANRLAAASPLVAPQALATLASQVSQQAAVIGYLNSFRLVVVIALLAMAVILANAAYSTYLNRNPQRKPQ